MSPLDYCQAARVPLALSPQEFGPWTIKRVSTEEQTNPGLAELMRMQIGGWTHYTLLFHLTEATLHQPPGDIVMEDSLTELMRHLPIWLAARGRVLITGLGLGCVVRGLLASPEVEHVDVVEIDRQILDIVGAEFAGNPRVALHHGDALTFQFPANTKWDCAWHDLWCDDKPGELHLMHAKLLHQYRRRCPRQGAWQFPRVIKRAWPRALLGARRRRGEAAPG